MTAVMMRCGCTSMATQKLDDGTTRPVCFTHFPAPESVEVDGEFALPADRMARCAYGCGQERPSSPSLAFFEYLGEGSDHALTGCGTCGFHRMAHGENNEAAFRKHGRHAFVARGGREFDSWYCGCRGWD